MRINWRRQHKWSGLVSCLFLVAFCVSGLVMNHRPWVQDAQVSRSWLPPFYKYEGWNQGLMRGTTRLSDGRVLIYGSSGMWITDSTGSSVSDFNAGLPAAAGHRQMRAAATTRSGQTWAASTTGLYCLEGNRWEPVPLPLEEDERLTDLTVHGDSVLALSRSYLYLSKGVGEPFQRVRFQAPQGAPEDFGHPTAFRTVWQLHSGELFGLPGRLVMDLVAVILIVLSLTGILLWSMPKWMKRRALRRLDIKPHARVHKGNRRVHLWLGAGTVALTLLAAFTGFLLRPPLMVPLVLWRVSPIPSTAQEQENPWHESLRMIRRDAAKGDWLLSTSEGYFSLADLTAAPQPEPTAPPVNVMGLNAWHQQEDGTWLCGSFSGLTRWDRTSGRITDWFTGAEVPRKAGPPFGQKAVSGFSTDLRLPDPSGAGKGEPLVVLYDEGTKKFPQPEKFSSLPMPLWNVAQEMHTGRLFFGNSATYFYVFIIGAAILWCLFTGWKLHGSKKIKKNSPGREPTRGH